MFGSFLSSKESIKKCILVTLFLVLPIFIFAQVRLISQDATKTYPDDTRITYMQLSTYPVDSEFLQFVEKEVLKNNLIQRFSLSKDGKTCFFHSQKDITENMIVDEINEAYYLYFTTYKHEKILSIDKSEFAKVEKKTDTQIVYFKVSGLEDLAKLKGFHEALVQDKNIKSVEINDDYLFKLNINHSVTPAYIQRILDHYDAKIDKEYINKF